MQSVLYAAKPEFQPVSGSFVKIIYTYPNESNDGGLHWLCFSNYMEVAEKYTLAATERAVAMIMCTPLPKIFVRHMKCPKQTNGNDRGGYAIANMISILHGIDPSSVSFNVSVMRRHLQQGLEIRKSLISPIENFVNFVFCKKKKQACVKSNRHSCIWYMTHARARLRVYMYRI